MQHAQADFVLKTLTTPYDASSNIVAFRRPTQMSGEPRGESTGNTFREVLGATHAKVDMLLDQVKEARSERRDSEAKLWMELRAIKHDMNNREQAVSLRLELADRRTGELERRLGEVELSEKKIIEELQLIRRPVEQIIELKRWVRWLAVGVVSLSIAIWAFGKPWYEEWVSSWFGHGK